MKNFRFKKLVMTLALSFLFVFCSIFPVVENTIPIYASVRLNTKKLTLEEGEKYTLKIKGSSKAFKWTTSDKSVAKVKRSSKYKNRGIVTAVSEGTAVIVATGGNKSYTCTVKVVSENNSGKNTATPTPTPTNKPSAGSAVDTFSVTDNGVMIKSNLTGNEIYSKSGYSVGYVRKYSKSGSSYDQYAYEDKSFKSEFETGDSYVINYFQGDIKGDDDNPEVLSNYKRKTNNEIISSTIN